MGENRHHWEQAERRDSEAHRTACAKVLLGLVREWEGAGGEGGWRTQSSKTTGEALPILKTMGLGLLSEHPYAQRMDPAEASMRLS